MKVVGAREYALDEITLVRTNCQSRVIFQEQRNTRLQEDKVWKKKWKEGVVEKQRHRITERRNNQMSEEGMRCGERQEEAETKRV